MNLTDDLSLKCLRGSPILFDDVCAIYPPTLGQIADLGYEKFLDYLGILLVKKPTYHKNPDLKKLVSSLSDFQFFIFLSMVDEKTYQIAKEAFFFFTKEKVVFSNDPAQIIVGPLSEKHLLTEENFYSFQAVLKKMSFLDNNDDLIIKESDSPRTRALKEQMRINREKVAKAKSKNKDGTDSLSFSDLVASLAAGGNGLNIYNIWNITYYAFRDQLIRMGWQEQFEINNRAALAGAKINKSQLKHWLRPISESEDK